MRIPIIGFLFSTLLALETLQGCCRSADTESINTTSSTNIRIENPWIRAVPAVSETSAAFMTLVNTSKYERNLVEIRSDVSQFVELHTHKQNANGMHAMIKIEKLSIPALGEAKLEPHGDHIMLIGLQRPLKAGDKINLKLVFADGGTISILAPVKHTR